MKTQPTITDAALLAAMQRLAVTLKELATELSEKIET